MISVLCPSRGRPALLGASLHSLTFNAAGPIQFLLAMDHDDPELNAMLSEAQAYSAEVWIPERRFGYYHFHEYVNGLARLAEGEWLLLWNDDATMEELGWDQRIAGQREWVVQTLAHGSGTLFPAVPTRWVRHLGHFALERHCDSWWEEIGKMLNRTIHLGLRGEHHNPDDQTSDDARGKKKNPDFYGAENMALIRADAMRVEEIL